MTSSPAGAELEVAAFLRRAGPFTTLPEEQLQALARQLRPSSAPAGQTLISQGRRGDVCYLIRVGQARAWLASPEGERQVETLGAGSLCGELALLSDVPNAITVRTVEPCQLLAIPRTALLATLDNRDVARRLVQLLQGQGRPRQSAGVEVHERTAANGETVHILQDPAGERFYQLSARGWFLWQRLDGQRSVRDLSFDLLAEFKVFDPQSVAEVLLGLDRAGFLSHPTLRADAASRVFHASVWQRMLAHAARLSEWTVSVPHVDAALNRMYRGGVWLLFTRFTLALLAVLTLAGLAAFVTGTGQFGDMLRTQAVGATVWLLLVPAAVVSILLHEAGHAFAVKAFGRHVPRAGLGLYWLLPVAYVDTSEMWLAGRWPRIAVSLAGPAGTLLSGSLAALAARLVAEPVLVVALYQYAAVAYLNVLQNLNPLLEFDGYYVLSDWLDRPNLRQDALRWLGAGLPAAHRDQARPDGISRLPGRLRGHRLDLLYGCLALAYLVALPFVVLSFYGAAFQGWLAAALPSELAAGLGWLAAGAVVALCLLAAVASLRPSSWLDLNTVDRSIKYHTRSSQ